MSIAAVWNKYITTRVDWKSAIKSGIVAGLSFAVGTGFSHMLSRPDALVSGLWSVLAAIVVLQTHLGGTYKEAYRRLLGVLIGSTLGAIFTVQMGSDPISLAISVVITIVFCSVLMLWDSIRIACMSAAVVIILWGLHPEIAPWQFALFRTIDSILGMAIAVVVAHALWPVQVTEKMQLNLSLILRRLQELCNLVFAQESDKEVTRTMIRQVLNEIDDLRYQTWLCFEEARLELLLEPGTLDAWQHLFSYHEQLIDQMYTLQKVYRKNPKKVSDAALTETVDKLLEDFIKAFGTLSQAFLKFEATEPLTGMLETRERLEQELSRFRETHTTYKFSLYDVENFFVFFYMLNNITDTLQKIEQQLSHFVKSDAPSSQSSI